MTFLMKNRRGSRLGSSGTRLITCSLLDCRTTVMYLYEKSTNELYGESIMGYNKGKNHANQSDLGKVFFKESASGRSTALRQGGLQRRCTKWTSQLTCAPAPSNRGAPTPAKQPEARFGSTVHVTQHASRNPADLASKLASINRGTCVDDRNDDDAPRNAIFIVMGLCGVDKKGAGERVDCSLDM
ncbi:hypothetical protein LR48_Vigan07g150300 [Vigna angularis]|uniref:Uncharacterized protein n=1 Tax=Phaseolus angularis TaxID=3914 RepID=A0A0L9UZ19_PHAAN|nr:hypothetical protein LR48_Vigan07g150300 [Vigna angularis]